MSGNTRLVLYLKLVDIFQIDIQTTLYCYCSVDTGVFSKIEPYSQKIRW